jgi:hypothetical protein
MLLLPSQQFHAPGTMGSEVKSSRSGSGETVSVGERISIQGADSEYVVIDVDHATGRMELLRLKPEGIESGGLVSSLRARSEPGPHRASEEE